jgi:hypothetical protein
VEGLRRVLSVFGSFRELLGDAERLDKVQGAVGRSLAFQEESHRFVFYSGVS